MRGRAALAGIAVLLVGCGTVSVSSPTIEAPSATPAAAPPTAGATPGPASAEPAGRAGDVAFLVERLEAIHPDPFPDGSREAVESAAAELAERAEELTEDEFLVALMRLVGGRDRDGHTGLVPFAQTAGGLDAWPLALYDFEEGLFVVDALSAHEDLEGMRIVAIGGRPIAEVEAEVAPLVSRDNEWTVRARLPGYLVVPAILRGLALLPDGAPVLTLEREDGTRVDVDPEPIPMGDWIAWRSLFYPLVPLTLPADDDGPRHLRHRGEFFWSEAIGDALYVGYHQVQAVTASGETIGGLATAIEAAFESGDVRRVIVDIRGNPGGNNFTYGPLLDALRDQAAEEPGSVVVLIGRSTFSAAGNFATELRAAPGVRFVGEPTGAAPNLYGDADEITLPHSGSVVHIATRTWEFAPGDDALAVDPDVLVPVRWSDYAAGVDAALDAALAD